MQSFRSCGLLLMLTVALAACSVVTVDKEHSEFAAAQDQRIAVMGRTVADERGALVMGYPGTSLWLRTNAAALSVRAQSTSDKSYIEYQVNDGPRQRVQLSPSMESIVLFEANDGSAKTVRITHRSESWHGLVTVAGFDIKGGELLEPPKLPQRKILLVGDSVTCAEAVDRVIPKDGSQCQKDTSWWDPRASYGMLLGEHLQAQVNLVCYGGRGLIRSWDGSTDQLNVPDFFELSLAEPSSVYPWHHENYQPDLVLISVGTNDFSLSAGGVPTAEQYVPAYVEFVKRVLSVHPEAQVVLTEGAMVNDTGPGGLQKARLQDYIKSTIAEVGSGRVHFVASQHYPGDRCDAHPTRSQHAAMAKDLAPALKAILGW